ncbi:MAG TPA: glycosyltransferase [Deltaproteobacteria bacterium]|nr:glycosyltransferase [Deltaproteobacteria bacterium]
MRIGLVVDRVGPGSGTAGVAHALIVHLLARGHEVAVRCRGGAALPEGVALLPEEAQGWLVVGLDRVAGCAVVRASGGVHRAWSRAGAITLWRWMRALGPDQIAESRREAVAYHSARIVICNSLRAAGEVVAWHRLPPGVVRIVRNGVDLQRFRPDGRARVAARARLGVPAPGRVALFLAHGWFRKGLSAALAGFEAAAGPEDRLVVAGRDAHRHRWLRPAARLGARLVVVDPGDPVPLLAAADVLIHPTRYDASANVVLEAMAAGVPPVTTLCDGAAEIVPDRGLVVGDPRDVAGIAAAVRYAWRTPGLARRCRVAAEAWPTSRMVGEVETILEEIQDG